MSNDLTPFDFEDINDFIAYVDKKLKNKKNSSDDNLILQLEHKDYSLNDDDVI